MDEHQHFHNPTQYVEIGVCIWCGHEFVLTKQHRKTLRTTGHGLDLLLPGKCSGKYGRTFQWNCERMPQNSVKLLTGNAEPQEWIGETTKGKVRTTKSFMLVVKTIV